MFDFLKRKKESDDSTSSQIAPKENATSSSGLLNRLKIGLSKTRMSFTERLSSLFLGKKELDESLLNQIESFLLTTDMGIETTDFLIKQLTEKLNRKELADHHAVFKCLQDAMKTLLRFSEAPFSLDKVNKPGVVLVVGVNGSGKTTSIGKLAYLLKNEQLHVMLAAGDTFRAAAIQQLQIWGDRNHVPVISQQPGADTAAVIYDALESAKAKGIDVLIADTAGRLHTQSNLMSELQKVKRVIKKLDPDAPHETLIVLDATSGQNALNQVKQFHEAIGLSGIILTKLDGTAKGGIIFAIANAMRLPIYFIGVGEGTGDLRPFKADEFVDALFLD